MEDETFGTALGHAEKALWLALERTGAFAHAGTKGSEREKAVARFLRDHLPWRFGVGSGEAFDAGRRHSGQLDLVIYDQLEVAPLPTGESSVLIPAEALLAVIEVKTTLSRAELTKCFKSVSRVSELRPFGGGKQFVAPRSGGAAADDGNPRCLYSIFAFGTDLRLENWLDSEWARIREVATELGAPLELVDRVVVLDRGMVIPPSCVGYERVDDSEHQLLSEWFVQLTNFLFREVRRRPSFEWMPYASKTHGRRVKKLQGWAKPIPAPRKPRAKPKPARRLSGRRRRRRPRRNGQAAFQHERDARRHAMGLTRSLSTDGSAPSR